LNWTILLNGNQINAFYIGYVYENFYGGAIYLSFGNASIFPFPAVQYIPMVVTNILQGNLNKSDALNLPSQLIAGVDLVKWRTLLWHDYAIKLPERFLDDSFPVLALNLKVTAVKYRGYFVTMVGQKDYGNYQLFTLPKHYFYKNKLCFELYDESAGERLARYSLFMP
jgi:hypothetical protein